MSARWMAVVIAAGALMAAGCGGGGKYADLQRFQKKMLGAMEAYVADLEKADSAKKVAAAMNAHTDRMEKLAPEAEKLQKRYPNPDALADRPKEMRENEEKMRGMAMRMGGAMMKIMPYMDDPEVRKAQERFVAAMSEFSRKMR